MPNYASVSAWTASGIGTSTINSAAASAASSAITNGSALDLLMDVSVRISSYTPAATNPYWELHLLPLLDDGTTYADRSAATLVDTAAVTTGASAKAFSFWGVVIPPGSFQIMLVNQSGTNATPAADPHYRTYATG